MTIKHTATLPDSTIAKRVSKSRTYSHCIAIRRHYEADLAAAKDAHHAKTDASNYAYHAENAAQAPGVPFTVHVTGSARPWSYEKTLTTQEHAKHVSEIADCATPADYAAKRLAQRLASVEADKDAGKFDKWGVAGWASRRDLADKAAAQYRNGKWDVEIVPAVIA